jgi:Cu/Ag efflux pump CusA
LEKLLIPLTVRNITSSSSQGSSSITVEFNLDKDLEEAANDVRDKVSQAIRSLPDIDAPPVVSKADANSDAIISMTVQSDTRSQLELRLRGKCDFATSRNHSWCEWCSNLGTKTLCDCGLIL